MVFPRWEAATQLTTQNFSDTHFFNGTNGISFASVMLTMASSLFSIGKKRAARPRDRDPGWLSTTAVLGALFMLIAHPVKLSFEV